MEKIYFKKLSGDATIRDVRNEFVENSARDFLKTKNIFIEKIKFEKTKKGKPFLQDYKDVHFSLSHSGKIIIAIFSDRNVGIDIEDLSVRNEKDEKLMKIAERFFHKGEINFLKTSKNIRSSFFEVWTKKESYLKLTGNGLSKALAEFSVFSLENIDFYKYEIGVGFVCNYAINNSDDYRIFKK